MDLYSLHHSFQLLVRWFQSWHLEYMNAISNIKVEVWLTELKISVSKPKDVFQIRWAKRQGAQINSRKPVPRIRCGVHYLMEVGSNFQPEDRKSSTPHALNYFPQNATNKRQFKVNNETTRAQQNQLIWANPMYFVAWTYDTPNTITKARTRDVDNFNQTNAYLRYNQTQG